MASVRKKPVGKRPPRSAGRMPAASESSRPSALKPRPGRASAARVEEPSSPGAPEAGEAQGRRLQGGVPIVGVGASAGGLDAFRRLLGALPTDTGMAYVLVQHLDPKHESILAELLGKATRMPVSEVKEETAVEPNHVYVTPGQNDVAIALGVLKLVPRITTGGRHLPIDSFFLTLAEAQGSGAIGVILSGTGSDGTLGAKAIKAAGGITFAQDPASAGYDGMARSAIAGGCADFVLSPERIAEEIARLSRHPHLNRPQGAEKVFEPAPPASVAKGGVRAILTLLRTATGTDFGSYKPPTIKRRITRRMALARIQTLAEYAHFLEGHADEVQALYRDCLITVTSFFRDPGTYEVLGREILPRILEDRPSAVPVRVWVPGCATGEEVYSIVICLLESAAESKTMPSFQVFGTDLSESGLETARTGRYPSEIAGDVSPERLRRFFAEVDGGYQVTKSIRDMCVFARHDVTRDPPFSRMDLISCRNLLIYLEPRMQQRVVALCHYGLVSAGFLLLGTSETTGASEDLFAPVDRKHRIYSKRPSAVPAVLGFGRAPTASRERPEGTGAGPKVESREELPREADRILLARYAPAGVIVDEKDNIVEFRGQTEPYLGHSHGRASLNLLKMARTGLVLEIRQAIQEARKKDVPVRKVGVSLRHRSQVRRLDLEVIPLRASSQKERSLLVLFEMRAEPKSQGGRALGPRSRASGAEAREGAQLRRELTEATRYLQAVTQQHEAANEELQASNEEVLSANEELQSINEELETAKEELQASNEELATLNQELLGRNVQLERALEYANGIVETVRNPLLILDAGLRVERANQSFYDYFEVSPEETVGRLVYELGEGQWNIEALRRTLDESLRKSVRLEGIEVAHEFPRIGLRTLVVNASKVRRESGQESVLLAFEDRTEARNTEREREALLALEQQARQQAEQADQMKDEFLSTLSHELRGPLSAMVGWVHILRGTGLDEATRELGRAAIERSVKAQTRLIEDLLDYSRVVAGKLTLESRLMDVLPVLGAAMEAVRSAAVAKQIRLELVTDAETAMVYGDPDRLQQVLWNLLSNAVKFTPRDGRIEVWIGRVEASLKVRVTDTGEGISREFLRHAFERFRQQDATSRRMHGGLGLGLAIVKELVELHGGTVYAESPGEGQGSTFTVALPVPTLLLEPAGSDRGTAAPSLPLDAPVDCDQAALEGARLLVVEDETESREMLVTLLERCGAVVVAVGSAREARQAMEQAAPDVLICDIGLPGEDGHEFLRKVRALEGAEGERIPALALTAYSGPDAREKALAAGFDVQVSKPVVPADLVAHVGILFGRRGERSPLGGNNTL